MNPNNFIKTTQSFEKLNLDFKLQSADNSKYFLSIVDKYSLFTFIYTCADMTTTAIIKCLRQLFTVFSLQAYI